MVNLIRLHGGKVYGKLNWFGLSALLLPAFL